MSHELELFQKEYLKKFSEEAEAGQYDAALQRLIKLSESDDLSELLSSIDTFRQMVFEKMWK
jgi:hypothetical protein